MRERGWKKRQTNIVLRNIRATQFNKQAGKRCLRGKQICIIKAWLYLLHIAAVALQCIQEVKKSFTPTHMLVKLLRNQYLFTLASFLQMPWIIPSQWLLFQADCCDNMLTIRKLIRFEQKFNFYAIILCFNLQNSVYRHCYNVNINAGMKKIGWRASGGKIPKHRQAWGMSKR